MTTKEYLQQAYHLDALINSNLLQIEDLRDKAMRISNSTVATRVQTSQIGDKTGLIIARIVDAEAELKEQKSELVALKREIKMKIDSLENPNYRKVLRKRHLEFKRWVWIANDMNYHYRTIYKIHKKALNQFEKKYPGL